MAIKTETILLDDLDESKAVETVTITHGKETRVLDLSRANFDKHIAPLWEKGHKTTRQRRVITRDVKTDVDRAAITKWAAEKGVTIAPRGRIKKAILEEFLAANPA